MISDKVLRAVLGELAASAGDQRTDWFDVVRRSNARGEERRARGGRPRDRLRAPRRRRTRVLLAVTLTVLAAVAVGVALAATDILEGPPAAPENDAALRRLMPPLGIGPATELASHGGRRLFGARTAREGYCFSATSPTDPKGEGGHCVSEAEARRLDARDVVAFAMSGSSVGGYAPGAESVHLTGAGIDIELPVSATGWWVGEARLASPPLPPGAERATVVATAHTADGEVMGRDPLLHVRRLEGFAGDVYQLAFV